MQSEQVKSLCVSWFAYVPFNRWRWAFKSDVVTWPNGLCLLLPVDYLCDWFYPFLHCFAWQTETKLLFSYSYYCFVKDVCVTGHFQCNSLPQYSKATQFFRIAYMMFPHNSQNVQIHKEESLKSQCKARPACPGTIQNTSIRLLLLSGIVIFLTLQQVYGKELFFLAKVHFCEKPQLHTFGKRTCLPQVTEDRRMKREKLLPQSHLPSKQGIKSKGQMPV